MPYFARFEQHNGAMFRFDTRIYLREGDGPGPQDTRIGAIIGKNPGAARHTVLGSLAPLSVGADKLLPTVKRCFTKAYAQAGKPIPAGAFVRVWNLFYLCGPDLAVAIAAAQRFPQLPQCASESDTPPIVWFAWGADHPFLATLKPRFRTTAIASGFFFDQRTGCIAARIPQSNDFARHTQGMNEAPVVAFLVEAL